MLFNRILVLSQPNFDVFAEFYQKSFFSKHENCLFVP